MNLERSGMSEEAQGETKWRLGELARVRGHHGHVSGLSLSLSLSLLHHRVLWKEIYQVRGYGFGAQFFFFF